MTKMDRFDYTLTLIRLFGGFLLSFVLIIAGIYLIFVGAESFTELGIKLPPAELELTTKSLGIILVVLGTYLATRTLRETTPAYLVVRTIRDTENQLNRLETESTSPEISEEIRNIRQDLEDELWEFDEKISADKDNAALFVRGRNFKKQVEKYQKRLEEIEEHKTS